MPHQICHRAFFWHGRGLHRRAVLVADAADAVERGLVVKIAMVPRGPERGAPQDLILHGDPANFIKDREPTRNVCGSVVVAGGGIEPPTCGL